MVMALAGFCRQCGQYVYVTEQWACINGHAWNEISGWYDTETGAPVTPPWMQPAAPMAAAVPAAVAVPAPVAAAPAPAPVVAEPVVAPAPGPEPVPAPAPEPVAAVVAPAPEPEPVAGRRPCARARTRSPAASDRLTLLADILATLALYPSFQANYGTTSDIVVDNQIVDASWVGGKKTVEYSAAMKAVEPELTLYFWEILKETSSGLNFGGFEAEAYTTSGTTRSGKQKMMVLGTDGVPVEWEWDYAATRSVVEDVARRHGWSTKVVLQKKSAEW